LEPKPAPSVCDVEVVALFIRRLGRDGVFFGRFGKAVEFDAPFAVVPFARASPLDLYSSSGDSSLELYGTNEGVGRVADALADAGGPLRSTGL
jgi:hypothetical protein